MRKWFAVTALLIAVAGIYGCGTPKPVQKSHQEEALTLNEKQLVTLFQGLVQMDRKEGLTFSKSQADQLLPIIRKNSQQGELTSVDQKKIIDVLNAAQKLFYTDFEDRTKKRLQATQAEKARMDAMSAEEREKLIQDFVKERKAKPDRPQDGTPPPPPPKRGIEDGGANNKNVERQLIELLESRAK